MDDRYLSASNQRCKACMTCLSLLYLILKKEESSHHKVVEINTNENVATFKCLTHLCIFVCIGLYPEKKPIRGGGGGRVTMRFSQTTQSLYLSRLAS